MTFFSGPINFTMFLTLFGEKLNGTDPEDVIQNAFACFDQRNTGNIKMFLYCNKCKVLTEISLVITRVENVLKKYEFLSLL